MLQVLRYRMIYDSLYRNKFDGNLLRYVTQEEAQRILHEFHYELSKRHYSGPTTVSKSYRLGTISLLFSKMLTR